MNEIAVYRDQERPELASLPSRAAILRAVYRQRWKAMVAMVAVMSLITAWTFLSPKRYSSEMELIVQNVRGEDTVTSGQGSGLDARGDVSEAQMSSEVSVLNSEDVMHAVVDPHWTPGGVQTQAQARAQEKAVAALRSALDISPVRGSHVIDVKLLARSPEDARDTLEQLLQVFLQKQRDLSRLPGASEVFNQQVADYHRQLQEARQQLADFQRKTGMVSSSQQEDALQTKLLDAQGAERDGGARIAELENRVAADRSQLATMPRRLPTAQSSGAATGSIDQLNVQLVNLENLRAARADQYGPSDPLLQQYDEQIRNVQAGIARSQGALPREQTTDTNPVYSATERDLSNSLVALAAARARHQSDATQITRLSGQVGEAESVSAQYETLANRVEELESSYKSFLQKRDAQAMNDLMDAQKWVNIAIVQHPTYSLTPARPRKALNLAFGVVCAFIFGACAVFLGEVTRQQVGSLSELSSVTHHPVLAGVPIHGPEGVPKRMSRHDEVERGSGTR